MKTYKIAVTARQDIVDSMRIWLMTGHTDYLKIENDEIVGIDTINGTVPITALYESVPDAYFAALRDAAELVPEINKYWAVERVLMTVTPNSITI